MVPQNWVYIIFNCKTCYNKGYIYGEPEKSSLPRYYVDFIGRSQSSET
jgi:hypothetical protein